MGFVHDDIGSCCAGGAASSSARAVAEDELAVVVRNAATGEPIARVRLRKGDTAARLRESLLVQMGQEELALHFVFQFAILEDDVTLETAGVSHGDVVFLVRSPLQQLSAPLGGSVRIWQPQNGDAKTTLVAQLDGKVRSAAFAPDGLALLTVSAEGEAEVWDVATGVALCRLARPGGARVLPGATFSPAAGLKIVGAADDTTAAVWCSRTGECLQSFTGHGDNVRAACFSPSEGLVATASRDWQARLWDISTGKCVKALIGHTDALSSASFAPSGRWLATAAMDCTARVWDTSCGDCILTLAAHERQLHSASFSPDEALLLTAAFDGTVRVWKMDTGLCALVLPAIGNVVASASFSPDGSTVLVASGSEDIRIFDAERGGDPILTLTGHGDWVRTAGFSPDGSLVTSASYDGTARVHSAVTGVCLQTLAGHAEAIVAGETTKAAFYHERCGRQAFASPAADEGGQPEASPRPAASAPASPRPEQSAPPGRSPAQSPPPSPSPLCQPVRAGPSALWASSLSAEQVEAELSVLGW